MIEIHPLRDKDKLSALYKEFDTEYSKNRIAVVASDGEEVLGNCLFEIDNDEMTVFQLYPTDDIPFADGILRSALFVGTENGVKKAFYTENSPVELFRKLGFIKNPDEKTLKIEKLSESCRNCH